ncbi:MAG: glucosaminidase domain-containing protein [Bacteroidaceae bacterium]|nr:glucosaminidase domain-containing protein [Bacteroidaceae bacterium]
MKHIYTILLASIIILVSSCSSTRSTSNIQGKKYDSYEQYIEAYYPIAVEQMERYNIPASITLAQGLLESGAGNSTLTRKSNNHFGIKADKSWKGKKTSSMDNGRKCYFRVYDNPKESYEDHSRFLVGRQRYAALFKLKKTDYRGWAKGLKKAGYAEDPAYPGKLISLIERYDLQKYDKYSSKKIVNTAQGNTPLALRGNYTIYRSSNLLYIVANTGDTFKSLSKATGVSHRKLIRYNDLYKDYPLKAGDIIYLEKKHRKALKPNDFHTTEQGESLHSIAQKYGIRLKNLLKMNPQFKEYATLKVGDILRLR